MSTDPAPTGPIGYEIWITGTVGAELLKDSLHLESRLVSPTTILRIETEDGPAEIVARLLGRGRDVVSVRLVA